MNYLRKCPILSSLIITLSWLPIQTFAQTKDWNPMIDQFWATPDNWNPIGIPTAADDVRIQSPLTLDYQVFLLVNGVANSIEIDDALLGIEGSLLVDEVITVDSTTVTEPAKIILYFNNSLLQSGSGLPGATALDLNGGSYLELRRGSIIPIDPPSVFNAQGLVDVDAASVLRGAGEITFSGSNGGLNLNGLLEAGVFGSTDNLLQLQQLGSGTFDLDGSGETGTIIVREDSHLVLSGAISDPMSGDIHLEDDSSITFASPGDIIFEGNILLDDGVSPGTGMAAFAITGNDFMVDISAVVDTAGFTGTADITVNANSLLVKGDIELLDDELTVNTPSPWQLEGEMINYGGIAFVRGSPLVVGSNSAGKAFLNAYEHIVVEAPITLEATATVRVIQAGALGRLTFANDTVFQGPLFNDDIGPWPGPVMGVSPAGVDFYGDLQVENSSTLYTAVSRFGEAGGTTSLNFTINPNQTLTMDVRNLITQNFVTLTVEDNATLAVIVRDSMFSPWINNMNIVLVNGTLDSAAINNQGSITGTGTIVGTVTGGGFVSPGLSPGTLTVNGNVQLTNPVVTMEISGNSREDFDQLIVDGNLDINGGVLNIQFIDEFKPQNGDSFQLFTATGSQSLGFADVVVSGLPEAAQLNTDSLEADGSVTFIKGHANCRQHPHKPHKTIGNCKSAKKKKYQPRLLSFHR